MTPEERLRSMLLSVRYLEWFVQNYRAGQLMYADGRIFGPWMF